MAFAAYLALVLSKVCGGPLTSCGNSVFEGRASKSVGYGCICPEGLVCAPDDELSVPVVA